MCGLSWLPAWPVGWGVLGGVEGDPALVLPGLLLLLQCVVCDWGLSRGPGLTDPPPPARNHCPYASHYHTTHASHHKFTSLPLPSHVHTTLCAGQVPRCAPGSLK